MITRKLWYEFKSIKLTKTYSIWSNEFTPGEAAIAFIVSLLITPFSILLDLILTPIEIVYYILKRHYERKLNETNNKR